MSGQRGLRLIECRQQMSCVSLGHRRDVGPFDRVGEVLEPAITQCVGGRARYGPDAADHVVALIRSPKNLALLLDHNPDQFSPVVIARAASLTQPQSLQRYLDEAHLVRHETENVCKLGMASR